jgi:hypothetical protein
MTEGDLTGRVTKEKQRRNKQWGPEILRRLAEPDPEDPALRKYATDEDVARACLGSQLEGVSEEKEREMVSRFKGLIANVRSRFSERVLVDIPRGVLTHLQSVTIAKNMVEEIKGMYPDQVLSDTEVVALIERGRSRSSVPTPTEITTPPSIETLVLQDTQSPSDSNQGQIDVGVFMANLRAGSSGPRWIGKTPKPTDQ